MLIFQRKKRKVDGGINQKNNRMKKIFKIKVICILLSHFIILSNIGNCENIITTNDIENIIEEWVEKNPEKIRSVLKVLEIKEKKESFDENLRTLSLNTSDLFLGNKNGDIKIYEFFDYNCGYCRSIYKTLLELIKKDKGIKLVLVEFPIFSGSEEISLIVLASKYQNSYHRLHERLMTFSGQINKEVLLKIAQDLNLNIEKLLKDSKNIELTKILKNNKVVGGYFGLNGTPSFIIGQNIIPGAIKKEQFLEIIDSIRTTN